MSRPAAPPAPAARRSGYEVVVGLEVHLALRTRTKLFCRCAAVGGADAHEPNRHVCPVCLGLPGALPVPNARALELAVRFAAALGCAVPEVTTFARKHYGYPDAPKNYQISQHDRPVGLGGALELPNGRRVGLVRCHLEEDAGRLIHPTYADHSLVDLDRAGAPLIELVTAPDLRSGEDARAFLEEVRALARALDVSDATPEEGRMRADVNVSLRRPGEPLGTKVEVKNLNSFKSVQAAIESEATRQERLLQAGRPVSQETRGWNEGGQKSYVMRTKEEAADYRYLDDPDLPPVRLTAAWLAAVRAATPETPAALRRRYAAAGLRPDDADRLATDADLSRAYDALVAAAGRVAVSTAPAAAPQAPASAPHAAAPQALANWLLVEVVGWAHATDTDVAALRLSEPDAAERLAALVALVDAREITGPTAKALLGEVLTGADPRALVATRGLRQVSDEDELGGWVDAALAAHPEVA
ncbi:MAG: Asp-tRNA(Asn)/Glu-tRNA(Gln) amidotransferase subunit GatB, partial [Trueperaceae bacterium]